MLSNAQEIVQFILTVISVILGIFKIISTLLNIKKKSAAVSKAAI